MQQEEGLVEREGQGDCLILFNGARVRKTTFGLMAFYSQAASTLYVYLHCCLHVFWDRESRIRIAPHFY